MPGKRPKPFLHRGWYCTNYGGTRTKLAPAAAGKEKAELQLAKLLLDKADTGALNKGPVLLGDLIRIYLDTRKGDLATNSYIWYRERLALVAEQLGHRYPESLTDADGRALKLWLQTERKWKRYGKECQGMRPSSVNQTIRAARIMFRWAASPKRRWINRDPWSEIAWLREKPRERLMTAEEFQALLSFASPKLVDMLTVLRYTGFRPSEMLTLEWGDIHWQAKQIRIPADRTKTGYRRVVTLVPEVEAVLRRRPQTGPYVFPGKNGLPTKYDNLRNGFAALRRAAEAKGLIQKEKGGERLVAYTTRHTRITELIRSGLDTSFAQREAGHVRITTTARYTHLSDDEVTQRVLDLKVGQASPKTSTPSTLPALPAPPAKRRRSSARVSPRAQ